MGAPVSLDHVTALAFDTPGNVEIHGLTSTSIDGSSFDAAFVWDSLAPGASHPGGLFDAAAGGLRLVEQHVDRHAYVYAPTGEFGPACVAAGLSSPCLVPRLATLAHDRLRTQAELAASLSGRIEIDDAAPVDSPPFHDGGGVAPLALFIATVMGLAIAIARWLRRRAAEPMARVRSAGRIALRALRGDVSRAPLKEHLAAMVARAMELDAARRACVRRLRTLDRSGIQRRREAMASPVGAEAAAWIDEEAREASRIEEDAAAAAVGMARIESALRVVALRLREHRGVPVRGRADPVDAAARELVARDEAIAETESALDSPIIP